MDAHVPFDELNGTREHEAVLEREAARERGASLVIGDVGSGKSSMIAGVAAGASTGRWIVRIQGGSAEDLLGREGFAHHVAAEAMRAFDRDQHAPDADPGAAEKRLADSRTRETGGHTFGGKAAQVRSAIDVVASSRQTSDLYGALDELVDVTGEAGRRMLLVVEDTDVFMPPQDLGDPAAEERARHFIAHVLPFLARELGCPSLVAVNSRYRDLVVDHLHGTVTIVDVPNLSDPAAALAQIVARLARRKGFHTDSTAILDPDAVDRLTRALSGGKSLRDVLRAIYDGAFKTAQENPQASHVSLAAVAAAL
jgi:hypothetical protein